LCSCLSNAILVHDIRREVSGGDDGGGGGDGCGVAEATYYCSIRLAIWVGVLILIIG
jgi:hypothetical protein